MTPTGRAWWLAAAAAAGCGREVRVGAFVAPATDAAADATTASDAAAPQRWPWIANQESGDLSEWTERSGTSYGGVFKAETSAAYAISSEQAHGGKYSVKMTIDTDQQSVRFVKLYRRGGLPTEARYRTWFFLPRAIQVDQYWNIMQWTDESGMLFDIGVVTRDGRLELYAHDHQRQRRVPTVGTLPEVPIGRWFEISAVLHKATNATGFFTVAQDGVTVVDQRNFGTVVNADSVMWNVGSAALALQPTPAVIYVDDAAIEPL